MSNQRFSPNFLSRMGFVLGGLSALAPVLLFRFTTQMMNNWEWGTVIVLLVLGCVLGAFFGGRRPLVGLLIIPASLFVVSLLCWFAFFTLRESKVAALRPRLADYTALSFELPQGQANRDFRIQGKIVAVDVAKRDFDPVHLLLPDALRAEKPEEVRNVVHLIWSAELVGSYPRGGRAFRRICDARVIEYSTKPRLLYEERFQGSDPPNRGSSSDQYGQPPYSQIVEFLKDHSSP